MGLERAGMTCVGQVEIEPFCQKVLKKHWPGVPLIADVREVQGHEFGAVDLICGGFPCQPHSLAGKRKGSEDERDLWGEYARLIGAIKPRWVVAENVPGLLSSEAGRFFGTVLRDLAALGYDAEWNIVSAADVGAPHLRERVFIVAYPASERRDRGEFPKATRRLLYPELGESGQALAYTLGNRRGAGREDYSEHDWAILGAGGEHAGKMAYSDRAGCQERDVAAVASGQGQRAGGADTDGHDWTTEPDVGRVANGVPRRVDRLRGLGNAVVPQVAEYVGKQIMEADKRANT